MVSIDQLKTDQADAEKTVKDLGLEYETLDDAELEKFGLSFDRQFVLAIKEREVVDILNRHRAEILMGAMVAKKQLAKAFDGERPEAGKFGMTQIRAGWIGVGDDWDDVSAFTGGALQNWIHSGTTIMGSGTAGHAVRIGKEAVHVVVAIGDLHPDPKIEAMQFTLDGKPKPGVFTRYQFSGSDLKIKELDTAFIFKRGTTVLAQVFQKQTGDSWPFLLGASFLPENILRDYVDPASLYGATNDVILQT